MIKLSTIIVTYNSEKTIEECLQSVGSQIETIVVDNNSTDSTSDIVKKFTSVKLIQNKENLGFGKANNIGVKNSTGDYLFFLNPDCIVEKNTIEKLCDYLDKNLEAAVVGPKLLNQKGDIQRELSPFPTVLSQALILLRLHRLPFFQDIVYPNYNFERTQEAEHLMGAALMVRKEIFEKVGGFDPGFFLWFEETDLLKRIKETGSKIIYYPEASVTHLVGQSTRQLNFLTKQTIWNKSLLYYFKKHKGRLQSLTLLPFIILSYPAALVSYLVKR